MTPGVGWLYAGKFLRCHSPFQPFLSSRSPQLLCLFYLLSSFLSLVPGSRPKAHSWLSSAPHLAARPAHLILFTFAGKGRGHIGGAESLKLAEPGKSTSRRGERGRRIRLSILRVWRSLVSAGMTSRDALAARVAGTGPRWLSALVPLLPASQSPIHCLAAKWRRVVPVGLQAFRVCPVRQEADMATLEKLMKAFESLKSFQQQLM